jgi:hypothetical protein
MTLGSNRRIPRGDEPEGLFKMHVGPYVFLPRVGINCYSGREFTLFERVPHTRRDEPQRRATKRFDAVCSPHAWG